MATIPPGYLRTNRDLTISRLQKIPGLLPYSPVATYLLWIDARELPVEHPHRFFEENGVGLSDGSDFGACISTAQSWLFTKSVGTALDRMEQGVLWLIQSMSSPNPEKRNLSKARRITGRNQTA